MVSGSRAPASGPAITASGRGARTPMLCGEFADVRGTIVIDKPEAVVAARLVCEQCLRAVAARLDCGRPALRSAR